MVTFTRTIDALKQISRRGVAVAIALAVTATLLLATSSQRPERSTTAAEGSIVARRYFEEVWNRGNPSSTSCWRPIT